MLQRDDASAGLAVRVVDTPTDLRVEIDAASNDLWSASGPSHVRVRGPSGVEQRLPLMASAPGHWSATLSEAPPGLYSITVESPTGARRVVHLRTAVPERGPPTPSAAIDDWLADGLVQSWSVAGLRAAVAATPVERNPPLAALALALVLFLVALAIERGE
jgi:hypothetical protein